MLFRKQNRHSLVLYILLLALFDFLIAAFYIPLMSVSVLADYFLEPAILNAWYRYMRPLITICHISMTASAFLILAASFERFCVTCWTSKTKFVNNFRQAIAGLAIFLGFITKISMYFEFNVSFERRWVSNWQTIQIIHEESCVGTMAEFGLSAAPIVYNYYYNLFWKIGFRNLVTIWVPFFLLLIMNLKVRRQGLKASGSSPSYIVLNIRSLDYPRISTYRCRTGCETETQRDPKKESC